jgi:ATP-dependent protease ClpP protease subunit
MNNFKYIKNLSLEDSEATILLYNTIGIVEDEIGNITEGINGEHFAKELEFLSTQVSKIHVRINSPGGNVMDGYSIISAILNSKAEIYTYNDGVAASIASLILIVGNKRFAKDYSITMIHNPSSQTAENEVLEKIKESLITILNKYSIYNKDTLNILMDKETYFNAEEAKEARLIDEIENNTEKFHIATKDVREMAAVFNLLINKTEMKSTKKNIIVNTLVDKAETIETIENKLGIESPETLTNELTPDDEAEKANEAAKESKKSEMLEDCSPLTKIKSDLGMDDDTADEDVYDFLKSMKDDLEKTKSTLADMVKEAKHAHKQRIDQMVNQLVISKKITKDEVVNVTKLAEVDFETTKNLFDKISTVSKHTSISNVIKQESTNPKANWTIRDYEKKDPQGLTKIKNENPSEYTRLYNEFYK